MDPPPLAPRRRTSAPARSPGPASATSSRAPPPGRGAEAHGERRCRPACARTRCRAARRPAPRGRPRPTATGSGPRATSVRTSRSVSSASTDQNATRSAHHLGGVAPRPAPRRRAGGGPARSPGDRALHARRRPRRSGPRRRRRGRASASSRSAVSGVRSRCERSATVSRSGAQQLADPPGQLVQRAGHLADSAGAGRVGPGVEIAARRAGATRPPASIDRPDQRCARAGRRPAGRPPRSAQPSTASSSQARPTPAVQLGVGDERRGPRRCAPAGSRTGDDDLPAAVDVAVTRCPARGELHQRGARRRRAEHRTVGQEDA